jgi:hypothetical protein
MLYGPRESTVRPTSAQAWCERLLGLERPSKEEDPTDAIIAMARLVGDRQLDLEEEPRKRIHDALLARGIDALRLRPLIEVVEVDASEESAAFGEGLPSGLRLAGPTS